MIDQTTQEEKQYRFELTEFKLKNPSADEKYFINHRIDILEDVLKDYKHTADFEKGEMLDGKEFINGVWTVAKTGTVSDHLYFSKELDFLKDKLIELAKPKKIEATSKKKDYKEEYWFVVGLLFATGEMQEALKKHNGNATEVAKLLKNEKGYRPFISDSMSNSTSRVTNIFSRPDKLTKIYLYCIENKIVMCDEFLSKYDQIEPE